MINCVARYFSIFAIILIIYGCASAPDNSKDIEIIQSPLLKETPLKSTNIIKLNHKAMDLWQWKIVNTNKIIALHPDQDSILYVYSFPGFKLLGGFGRVGRGPSEFVTYNWGQTASKDGVILYDIMKKSLYDFEMVKDSLILRKTFSLYSGAEGNARLIKPFTKIQRLEDNIFLLKVDEPATTNLEIADLENQLLLSSFPVEFESRNFDTGYPPFDFEITLSGKNLILPYNYMDRIEFCTIDKNYKIERKKIIGDSKDQVSLDESERVSYYMDVQNDGKYIYLLNLSNANFEMQNHNVYIDVYTVEGEPVKRFVLAELLLKILVDPATNKLYGYSQSENSDNVYVYELDI